MQLHKRNLIILIVLGVVTLLPFLGMTDFNTKGAPREAVVSYTMLETGNWVLPRNYGGDIAFKPPFFHWSIAAVSSVLGGVTEYSSRVPSALALIVMLGGIYLFYAKRKNPTVALLTAGIAFTCFEVHRAGFACRVDTVLTVFIVLAMLQFYQWYEKELKGIPWLAILFMSCATLTKGPVGIILPCLVIAVFLWIRIGRFWKVSFTLAGIALLACVLPGIWYYMAYAQGGGQFLDLMMEENFGRFLGKMSYESHENPAYYNVYMLLAGYLPWSILGLFSLFCLHYRKVSFKESLRQIPATVRNSDPVNLYSFLVVALIFVFYCIPASKRSVYLLPIYPFIAYFLAVYFQYLLERGWKAVKGFGILMSVLAVLVTLVFIVVKCGFIPGTIFSGKHAAENAGFLYALENVPLHLFNLIVVALPVAAVVWLFIEMKRNARKGIVLYALCGLLLAIFVAMDGVYQPAILNTKSDKVLAAKVQELVPEGSIYSYGSRYFYSVNYYTGDRMAFFDVKLPDNGILLTGSRELEVLQQNYGQQYDFEEIYVSPSRSCDTRDIVHIFRFVKKQ